MSKRITLALSLVLAACGGSPQPAPATTPPSEAENQGTDDAVAAGDGDGSPGDAKGGEAVEERRFGPPPPPEGPPPAWLSQPAPAYRAGDALKYLPKDCTERVYFDTAAIVGADAADVKKGLENLLTSGDDQREKARVRTVIRIVRQSGADPVDHWREIAMCKADGREFTAIGIATDTPFEAPLLVQKVKIGLEEDPGAVVRQGDVSMLTSDGETFAQPAPGILLVGRDKDRMLAAAKLKAGAPGFAPARGHLVFVATDELNAAVKQQGTKLDVRATLTLPGRAMEGAKPKANEVVAEFQRELNKAADKMTGTPLAPLGERLRAAKITAVGNKITFTGSVERPVLVNIVKQAASGELEKFLQSLK